MATILRVRPLNLAHLRWRKGQSRRQAATARGARARARLQQQNSLFRGQPASRQVRDPFTGPLC